MEQLELERPVAWPEQYPPDIRQNYRVEYTCGALSLWNLTLSTSIIPSRENSLFNSASGVSRKWLSKSKFGQVWIQLVIKVFGLRGRCTGKSWRTWGQEADWRWEIFLNTLPARWPFPGKLFIGHIEWYRCCKYCTTSGIATSSLVSQLRAEGKYLLPTNTKYYQ